MSSSQETLAEFTPDQAEIDVTRTVRLKLKTSQRKTQLVEEGIDAYQQVARQMAAALPSYPDYQWEPHHSHMYHHAKRFLPDDDTPYKTTLAQQAQQQVAESFKSWRENGKPGDSPATGFGDGDYLGLRGDCVEIVQNDAGWGVKTGFISYNPVWFHIDAGTFQREFLERITDADDPASAGKAELHLSDAGQLYCHLTVSWPVETYAADDVATTIGVDLNDDPLVAVAVVDGDGDVSAVEVESGGEYRHHREHLKKKRHQASADGDLRAVKSARYDYLRYTDHVTNVASRRVVDVAVEHAPAKIRLEDLTHYRETASDPVHDWPFAETQAKIISKAEEEGLPVTFVDPRYTSVTCRRCGATDDVFREGSEFECLDCGYEVHADVNAAINIARGGINP